ncbi:MAG: hypothetical protein ACM3UY_07510 [Methanocella sp.]
MTSKQETFCIYLSQRDLALMLAVLLGTQPDAWLSDGSRIRLFGDTVEIETTQEIEL